MRISTPAEPVRPRPTCPRGHASIRVSSFTGMLPSSLFLLPALLAQEPPPATYRGVPAAEWLQRLQRGGDDESRPQVSCALRELAIDDAAVARQLAQLLTSGELRVRRTAAWCAEHRCAVPFLVDALDDADGEVRRNATITLARLGAAAADATPHLVQRLARAEGDFERHAAAEALALIGTAHADALPALLGLVRDDADSTSSVRTLLTNHGATAVPLLQPLLQQPGRAVAAADILLDLADHHPVAIAAIEAVATGDEALQFRLLEWKARRNHAAVPEFVRRFAHDATPHKRRRVFDLDLRLDA